MTPSLPDFLVDPIVRAALAEDLGRYGDVTSAACIPQDARLSAAFVARKAGIIAGVACARLAIAALDPDATFTVETADGETATEGAVIARVEADARALLSAERVALNLLGRLSGIATLTRAYVEAVDGLPVRIADTRKTTPGLRALEKHAVACGGGLNHRMGLDDAIMIKDNHIAVCGGVGPAIERAQAARGHLVKIEVEVDDLDQLGEAIAYRPDVVLADNFSIEDLKKAADLIHGRAVLEASGGVNLETVRAIAQTGVNVISVGALTHSAPSLDVALDAV